MQCKCCRVAIGSNNSLNYGSDEKTTAFTSVIITKNMLLLIYEFISKWLSAITTSVMSVVCGECGPRLRCGPNDAIKQSFCVNTFAVPAIRQIFCYISNHFHNNLFETESKQILTIESDSSHLRCSWFQAHSWILSDTRSPWRSPSSKATCPISPLPSVGTQKYHVSRHTTISSTKFSFD